MTKIIMTKDGRTAELFPNQQVNAFVSSGWELAVGNKKITATKAGVTKTITNTPQLNAYINAPGWVISVDGEGPPREDDVGKINIAVKDSVENKFISDVSVDLRRNGNRYTTFTTSAGWESIENCPTGTYTAEITAGLDGYIDPVVTSAPTSVDIVSGGGSQEVTISLGVEEQSQAAPMMAQMASDDTREALEKEAASLGVTYNKNISTENLQKRVETARQKAK